MIFTPQKYTLADVPGQSFIDPSEIEDTLARCAAPLSADVDRVIARAMRKERLSMEETAILLQASANERLKVLEAAETLKKQVYGERIVLFAPLYIGNRCMNRCAYCSFRADSTDTVRKTLSVDETIAEVHALAGEGHRRLILVYGEHPLYDARFIADSVRTVYNVDDKNGHKAIRRVNINAAPLDVEGFRTVRQAGIGTYQVFQETYCPSAYKKYHLGGPKSDFDWRLTAFDRAMEAGIDDVGLGVLLGLHDWRYEILALIRHTNHLEACFGVGPHTISFPRIKESSASLPAAAPVGDDDFIYAIAVLRLAVPYTGLILTAREPAAVRDQAIRYGVSQIDGGTKLEIGSYSATASPGAVGTSQFALNDERSLGEIIEALIGQGRTPSFCTACYRKGRTGEHFMEFSVPGFIKRFCTPNALFTLAEYLEDYASIPVKTQGWELIRRKTAEMEPREATAVGERLERIKAGERDLYF